MTRQRAFSTVELLVVLAIIGVLVVILVPVLGKARESSRRAYCATNLRSLGTAVRAYGEAHNEYPRTKYDITPGGNVMQSNTNRFGESLIMTAFTGARGANPFYVVPNNVGAFTGTEYPSGTGTANNLTPANNDITAALFLLIRTGYMSSKQFVCPSAEGAKPDTFDVRTAQTSSNFTDPKNLSYSYTIPYPTESWLGSYNDGNPHNSNPGKVPPASYAGYTYGKQMKAKWPMAADLNPGNSGTVPLTSLTLNSSPADMKQGNSRNHAREGQNVLYVAGHVEWVKTPFAGSEQDNMYTRAESLPDDNALTPTATRSSSTVGYTGTGTIGVPDVNTAFGRQPPTNINDTILLPTADCDALLPYKKNW